MRKGRLGYALLALASTLGALASCGDDPISTMAVPDGGAPDGSGVPVGMIDGSRVDTGIKDGGAGVRAVALNGITAVESPIRFCFLASKSGPPTLADGVDSPALPSAPLGAGTLDRTTLPSALVDSYVKIVVYYEESLSAFGVADKTCKELAAMSSLVMIEPPADAGSDASDDDAGYEPDASDDAGDASDDAGDASDDAGDASDDAGDASDDASAPGAVPMGGGTGGLRLLQYADFDISEEVIPPSTIKADALYLLYASGCTHRQSPSHAFTICNNDETYYEAFGTEQFTDFYAWLIELDTSSPASPSSQSRVQAVLGSDVWRQSELFEYQTLSVLYGDASVEVSGPGGDPLNPDAGTFPYIRASKPAYPATLLPSLTNATGFSRIIPYYDAQITLTKEALELSGLTAADLATTATLTLVPLGSSADEPEKLSNGKLNPRYLGFRIIINK